MFEDRMGFNQAALIDDSLTRQGVELWLERVRPSLWAECKR